MVDVSQDCRWGRIAESAGEDPYLNKVFAKTWTEGLEEGGAISCVKHFAAYGAAQGGRDYNKAEVSERTLREVFLPPFKKAIDSGAKTLMTAFQDLGGIPATIHPLLHKILREEWGFTGVVVSDYNALLELIEHGVAADLRHAAKLGIEAGIDVDMVSEAYSTHLADLIKNGEVAEDLLDKSVARVLKVEGRNSTKEGCLPSKDF